MDMISEMTGECVCISSDELLAMVRVMTSAEGSRALPVLGWHSPVFEQQIFDLIEAQNSDWVGLFSFEFDNPFEDENCFSDAVELVANSLGARVNNTIAAIRRDEDGTLNTWIDNAQEQNFSLCLRIAREELKTYRDKFASKNKQGAGSNILYFARLS